MAHFAELDQNNVVKRVVVVANASILDENGNESEELGIQFMQNLLGPGTIWKQTSYNANFRKNYAAVGGTYSPDLDAFIPPKPPAYPSWVLDEETCKWVPPAPYPQLEDDVLYKWDEATHSWIPSDPAPEPQAT